MKVTIKLPLTDDKFVEFVAEGAPKDIAEFVRLWLMGSMMGKVPKLSDINPITA